MGNNVKGNIYYVAADETELNRILQGDVAGISVPWQKTQFSPRHRPGTIGVLLRKLTPESEAAQPLVLIVPEDEQRRLFGRFAQVRNELSPLSAWCHIVSPKIIETVDDLARDISLRWL